MLSWLIKLINHSAASVLSSSLPGAMHPGYSQLCFSLTGVGTLMPYAWLYFLCLEPHWGLRRAGKLCLEVQKGLHYRPVILARLLALGLLSQRAVTGLSLPTLQTAHSAFCS